MDGIQATQLQSLRAAQQFLDAHGPSIGTINSSGARRRMDELVTQVEQCLTTQEAALIAGRGETRRYQQLRQALLTLHMAPIEAIAHRELASTPEVSAVSIPRGNPSVTRLAAAARGMAQLATSHAPIFIEAGLPTDFIARLLTATDAMQASFDARSRWKSERRIATASVARHLRGGRQQLHILGRLLISDAPVAMLLEDFRVSTRVPRRPRLAVTPTATATARETTTSAVPLELPLVQRMLPAPAPMKQLTSGATPAVVGESRGTSMITAMLQRFRRMAA